MHILTEGSGSPSVVIVPALASNVLEWVRVQRAASAETQIVVYDRAGIGGSDPLTIDGMADGLHGLLGADRAAPGARTSVSGPHGPHGRSCKTNSPGCRQIPSTSPR